jgi:hypothetical protein
MGPDSSIDLPAPPLNDIVEGQEVYIVNACSGHVTWHEPSTCVNEQEGDEKCELIELDHMDIKIRNEHVMWARAGMSTEFVTHNLWNMDTQIMAVIEVVEGMVGKDKLNEIYKQKLLDKLHTYRDMNEDEVRKARSKANLAVAQRKILGPNGQVMN